MQLLESHEQLNSASCRVCRCLAKIKPPSLDGKNCGLMQCSAAWAFDINTGIEKQEENTLSSSNLLYVYSESEYSRKHVQKNGALCLFKSGQHYDIGIQPTDSSTIPFAALRGCIAHCRRSHYQACVRKLFPNASAFKLRLIDCRDPARKVIQAPTDCKYVALSYVWGDVSNSSTTQYPKAVEDAIIATLSMELQYLWVDAYCIDQNNASDKHQQIAQMGSIYANAEITFVAAAGIDSTYGLPGISRTCRQQGTVAIDGVTLLEAFPHTFYSVQESVWASRGWTFQEAFLSPRRLIFTDSGVSFLCNRMCIAEWEKLPLHAIPASSTSLFGTIIPCAYNNGLEDDGPMQISVYNAESMLREYSRRRLSYGSDALNASLGIIQLLEGMNLYSVWGVLTHDTAYPQMMIYWHHKSPTRRRPGFPSWSYLGWEGQFDIAYDNWPKDTLATLRVSIGNREKPDFGGKPIHDVRHELKGLGDRAPCYLHLEAPMVDIALERVQWTDEQKSHRTTMRTGTLGRKLDGTPPSGVYASFQFSAGVRMLVRVYVDEADFEAGEVVVGVIYGMSISQSLGCRKARMLLFQDRGSGHFERVGALNWDLGDPTRLKSLWTEVVFANEAGEQLDEVRIEESVLIEGVETRTIVVK
ncbi:hypothetical protein Hte_010611 [Hypoxylon texense]